MDNYREQLEPRDLGRYEERAFERAAQGIMATGRGQEAGGYLCSTRGRYSTMPPVMLRAMRVESPGVICHVMDRGNRRKDIFADAVGRQDFLETLAEACQKARWQVHGYETTLPMKWIGARLQRETTLATRVITARVHLRSSKVVNRGLHHYLRRGGAASAGQGQLGIRPTQLPEMTQALLWPHPHAKLPRGVRAAESLRPEPLHGLSVAGTVHEMLDVRSDMEQTSFPSLRTLTLPLGV